MYIVVAYRPSVIRSEQGKKPTNSEISNVMLHKLEHVESLIESIAIQYSIEQNDENYEFADWVLTIYPADIRDSHPDSLELPSKLKLLSKYNKIFYEKCQKYKKDVANRLAETRKEELALYYKLHKKYGNKDG